MRFLASLMINSKEPRTPKYSWASVHFQPVWQHRTTISECKTLDPTWSDLATKPNLPVQHGTEISLASTCTVNRVSRGGNKATCLYGQLVSVMAPKQCISSSKSGAECPISEIIFVSPAFWLVNKDDQGERDRLGASNSLIAVVDRHINYHFEWLFYLYASSIIYYVWNQSTHIFAKLWSPYKFKMFNLAICSTICGTEIR